VWHAHERAREEKIERPLGLGATRGVARNWRWHRGAAEAQHMAGETVLTPAAGVQRAKQSSCQRRKKRGGGPGDFVGNCKNLRDVTENRNFPLIQSPNEEKVKIEVVELFKSYNFALGLKFSVTVRVLVMLDYILLV
jgi:hypothetical protein